MWVMCMQRWCSVMQHACSIGAACRQCECSMQALCRQRAFRHSTCSRTGVFTLLLLKCESVLSNFNLGSDCALGYLVLIHFCKPLDKWLLISASLYLKCENFPCIYERNTKLKYLHRSQL